MTKPVVPYPAPVFSLPDETGKTRTLQEFAGSWLVLYFYPKDDTPGCTVEACSLRDASEGLKDLNAHVIGISKDDSTSHQKFKTKHNLSFTLLADVSGDVINAYGAWGPKMFGKVGIQRKTFLIDPNGMVQKVYGRVTPLGHGEQVTKDIAKLKAKA